MSVRTLSRLGLTGMCLAGLIQAVSAANQPPPATRIRPPKLGAYACSNHHFDSLSGLYEYRTEARFSLAPKGKYNDASPQPSGGVWLLDGIRGELRFKGGELDGAVAQPIAERPNHYFMRFPAQGEMRWTCSLKP